jgi:hypothetical protein
MDKIIIKKLLAVIINSLKFEEIVIEIRKDYEDFNKENFIYFLNM